MNIYHFAIVQVDSGKLFLVVESNVINQNNIVQPYSAFRPTELKDRSPRLKAYWDIASWNKIKFSDIYNLGSDDSVDLPYIYKQVNKIINIYSDLNYMYMGSDISVFGIWLPRLHNTKTLLCSSLMPHFTGKTNGRPVGYSLSN